MPRIWSPRLLPFLCLTTIPEWVRGPSWPLTRLPKDIADSPSAYMDWQIAQYAKYIRVMDLTARDFGIKSMFFLQPVPAVDKTLTAEERRGTPDMSVRRALYRDRPAPPRPSRA